MAQLRKASLNCKEHRTSLHVLSLAPFSPVHIISSNDSTGSPLNTASISNLSKSLSTLSIPLNLLIDFQPCMLVIPLILLGCQISICSPSHEFTLCVAPIVSALWLLQFEILSLQPSKCVPALTPSAIIWRPTISSRSSNWLSAILLRLRFSFSWPLCAFTNYIYLLTCLLLTWSCIIC